MHIAIKKSNLENLRATHGDDFIAEVYAAAEDAAAELLIDVVAYTLIEQSFNPSANQPPPENIIEALGVYGVGTELTKLLTRFGFDATTPSNCECRQRRMEMDRKGEDWCAENIDMLVGWLGQEAKKRDLPFTEQAGRVLIRRAISLSRQAKQKRAAKDGAPSPSRADPQTRAR